MNTTKPVTAKALAALETLRAAQPFHVVPARVIRARESRKLVTICAYIETGIHTTVLTSLRNAGLITYTTGYLGGRVTPDLQIVEPVADCPKCGAALAGHDQEVCDDLGRD